ncbi:MAG TPA: VOC family protein [Bryobacteraceae bacterium]|nr:VOC family protein [Bryobacteraceae bacterium]
MPEPSLSRRLDLAVEAMLELRPDTAVDPGLAPLLGIARDLRGLPRESFKARLKSDLERRAFMATQAQSVSAVRQTAAPRLRIKNAAAAIEFYKKAFGARELFRFEGRGEIAHAEIAIGNSVIMLGEEAPEYGYPGPEALGGSPVAMHLYVDDADAMVAQAVAAGATLTSPVRDQFYGDRSGGVKDPFGYLWGIATRKKEMSPEEMQRHFDAMEKEREKAPGVSPIPAGYRTITPYLVAADAAALIDFVKQTFSGEEKFRTVGSAGGIHCEMLVGDSMLMIGGGGPGLSFSREAMPTALHIYVEDTDAVYRRALEAGAESIGEPADHEYGERGAGVKDAAGNFWYIATYKGARYVPEGLGTVTPYLHPRRAEPVIRFLERAFGAKELEKYASPDGVIHHAKIRIGDSALEMGEANGPYQPMPAMYYLYVPDVDATYARSLQAGATSISEPANQSYGDRSASVKDSFGNTWYIATHIKDVTA